MSTWVQQAGRRGFKAVLSCGLPRKSRATPNNQQRTTIYATRRTRERLPHTLGTAFISSMLWTVEEQIAQVRTDVARVNADADRLEGEIRVQREKQRPPSG